MKKKIINILDIFVSIGLFLTILFMIGFPLIFTAFTKNLINLEYLSNPSGFSFFGIISFYILTIPYIMIIFNLKRITKLFKSNDLYNKNIINFLNHNAYYSIAISILFIIINIILYMVFDIYLYAITIILIIIIPFLFIVLGLIFLVISHIYREVIDIKEENDLTI